MNFDDTARFLGPSNKLWPDLFMPRVKLATKRCLECHKREIRSRQKYCAHCARKKKRESNRDHIWRKRHHEVGKLDNSPIRAEGLTKTETQARYDDPKAPFSPPSFPTDEEPRQPSEPNGKLNEHTGKN